MKRLKKILKVCGIVILAVVLLTIGMVAGLNQYIWLTTRGKILDVREAAELKDVDCILVLGASVRNGDTPSPMLEDRLKKGIELYRFGAAPKLLMSGDHLDRYYDEVTVMKNYAINAGCPSEDIFLDHAGLSTYESMYRAKYVFGVKRMIIVTQRYHLYRAIYDARRMGIDAYGVAAEEIRYSGQSMRDLREILANVKDFVQTLAMPEPTVMGDPVSLEGNGDTTN